MSDPAQLTGAIGSLVTAVVAATIVANAAPGEVVRRAGTVQ